MSEIKKSYADQLAEVQELKKKYNLNESKLASDAVNETIEVVDTSSEVVEIDDTTDYSSEALRQGWVPKEKFKGDPKDFVDAETYVKRGQEFRKIQASKHELDSENKKLTTMVKELVDNLKHAEERVRAQTIAELEQRKRQAYENNDLYSYKQLEQQEAEVLKGTKPTQQSGPDEAEFNHFVSLGNEWATQDDDQSIELRTFATLQSNKYCQSHPNATHEEQFKYIHEIVREKYPHYFGLAKEPTKARVGASSGPVGTKSSSKTFDLATLTPAQRMIYNSLKNDKSYGMSPEDYLKSLSK